MLYWDVYCCLYYTINTSRIANPNQKPLNILSQIDLEIDEIDFYSYDIIEDSPSMVRKGRGGFGGLGGRAYICGRIMTRVVSPGGRSARGMKREPGASPGQIHCREFQVNEPGEHCPLPPQRGGKEAGGGNESEDLPRREIVSCSRGRRT